MKHIHLGSLILILFFLGLSSLSAQDALPPAVDQALKQLGMIPFNDNVVSVDFSLPSLDGEEYGLSDYPDRLIMLNFWATWCGPCRTEMPSMQALYNDYSPLGLEMIAVNQREAPTLVQDFIDEFRYTFPVLMDGPGVIGFQYGVRSIPLTYLITPDGRIIAGKPGAQDWNTPRVREALEVLLDYYL